MAVQWHLARNFASTIACWAGLVGTGLAEAPTLSLLDAHNQKLSAERVLGVSRRITHDSSLSRDASSSDVSEDSENFRVELEDASEAASVVFVRIESVGPDGSHDTTLRHVPLLRVPGTAHFRSPFIRLVADATDASAPDVGGQILRVRLRSTVRIVARLSSGQELAYEARVGAAGTVGGARAALRGTLRVSVLRLFKGGPPVVGDDDAEAIALARGQVEIANEIWAQCFIDFGAPNQAEVRIVDPPPPSLLAVADVDGLPAMGGGSIRFRINGRQIAPIPTQAGATSERTAMAIARAAEQAGYRAEVSVNPRAELGAGSSADIVVRDKAGQLVTLTPDGNTPLSSDARQTVKLGGVDLADGIDEFDNTLSATGTLEERTLVKLVADADPSTIDVILVNRFVNRDRQGEAFIEADGSALANTLVFDRNAVRYDRQAWVQAHELGHVLLDEAFHPDNLGADRPWLLMDADARQGRVTGPKRLSDEECDRARRRSGPAAYPALLRPAP